MNEGGESERELPWRRFVPALSAALCALGLLVPAGNAEGQSEEGAAPDSFEDRSLALRTALHYDASIDSPLQSLVKLYGESGRLEELLGIYRAHILQYPDDASAQAVLIRLFRVTRDPEAGPASRAAVVRFPQDDYVRYLYYRELETSRDPAAIEELSKAVFLTKLPNRKRAWLDELLAKCLAEGRGDLALKQLESLLADSGGGAAELLELGKKMHASGLHELALETLGRVSATEVSPEAAVEIELLAAKAEGAMGKNEEAASRLDALLGRVAPDYWRRSHIVMERVHLLGSDAARGEMLRKARERFEANPKSEAAALDLAEVLIASELRRDALAVLLKASRDLPYSEPLEKKAVELFDRLGDEHSARAYLEERLEAFPDRLDLRYRLVKALYLSGLSVEAGEEFTRLVDELDGEERFKQQLDLARFLRRMNQPADAVALFEKIVAEQPGRVDILRELGEAYLAIGRRESARRLFVETLPKEVEIENLLDAIQFLMQQGMLLEASGFLEERLAEDDGNFDLRLLAIEVYGKSGEQLAGEALVTTTRELADTLVRYHRWLETATGFHEVFDGEPEFLETEQLRLTETQGEWSEDRVSRFLSFCEVAGRYQQQDMVAATLRDRVFDEDLPGELRTRLRRLLIESLERDPLNAGEVQEHLAVLMREDGERADEYRLRQARLHRAANRPDLILPLLENLDLDRIGDVVLLGGSIDLFLDLNMTIQARRALERLTELDPDTLSHWEKLLGVLGSLGEEEALRKSIRRLLAGVDRVDLADESVGSLKLHLLDSYWRSIARILADGAEGRYAEVFQGLNEIEREGVRLQDELWVLWTRAFLLNRMGQTRARDEAIDILMQVAAKPRPSGLPPVEETPRSGAPGEGSEPGPGEPAEARIAFPDGLSVSLDEAVAILREPPMDGEAQRVEAGEGPGADLELAWIFESDPGTAIVQMEVIDAAGTLVLDDQGNLYRVDSKTGKLSWRKGRKDVFGDSYRPPDLVTSRAAKISLSAAGAVVGAHLRGGIGPAGGGAASIEPPQIRLAPRFAPAEGGRFLIPAGSGVRCFDAGSGKLRWVSEVGGEIPLFHAGQAGSVPPELRLFPSGDRVFTFEPRSGVACCVALDTGKLIWRTELYGGGGSTGAMASTPILFGLNAGASLSNGKLLVYGRRAAIIDCREGKLIWTFDAEDVRTFPVGLKSRSERGDDLDDDFNLLAISAFGISGSQPPPSAWIDHLSGSAERRGLIPNFLRYSGALVAPALQWVQEQSRQMQPARGVLRGSRMFLMGREGVRQFSLGLPLAARSYPVTGTLAGFAGGRACVLKGNEISLLHTGKGTVSRLRIDGLAPNEDVEVALSGPRVYLASRTGIDCVNAHTAAPIFHADWPEELAGVFDDKADENRKVEYYWDGVEGNANGKPGYCVGPRNRVSGEMLLAIVGPGRVAALSSAK